MRDSRGKENGTEEKRTKGTTGRKKWGKGGKGRNAGKEREEERRRRTVEGNVSDVKGGQGGVRAGR